MNYSTLLDAIQTGMQCVTVSNNLFMKSGKSGTFSTWYVWKLAVVKHADTDLIYLNKIT